MFLDVNFDIDDVLRQLGIANWEKNESKRKEFKMKLYHYGLIMEKKSNFINQLCNFIFPLKIIIQYCVDDASIMRFDSYTVLYSLILPYTVIYCAILYI